MEHAGVPNGPQAGTDAADQLHNGTQADHRNPFLIAKALAEDLAPADLSEGVLSVVPGGVATGQALTSNPDIDMFTFTSKFGRREGGRQIGC